jgi:signal transduction histidine kinase
VFVSTRCDVGTATIAVRDEGVGIAPELIGRLGQPFIQGDNAYSRTQEGVGLGLSIVKGLARYHDGAMQIESTQGVGTCVTVTLPKRDRHPGTMNLLAKGAAGLDAAPPII